MRPCRRTSGFSLVELMITLVVIAVVAAVAIPAMLFAIDRSKQRATLSDMRSLGAAISRYSLDHAYYPNGGLTAAELIPYLHEYGGERLRAVDRWSNAFDYVSDGRTFYSILSFGRDGIDGEDIDFDHRNDFNRDIVYAGGQFLATPES